MTSRHLAFLVTRALVIATGFAALTLFPAHPVESWQGLAFPGNNWIDGLVRWDSFWYESIVDPHPRFVPEYLSNANFFPFYSWVSWVVSLPHAGRYRIVVTTFVGDQQRGRTELEDVVVTGPVELQSPRL